MWLTSYERMRRYLSAMDGNAIEDTANLKRELSNWIAIASAAIENYTKREFELKTRTEYFYVDPSRTEWYLSHPPAASLSSVYEDSSGLWDGGESEISESYIGEFGDNVVIPAPLGYRAPKGLRAIYEGGFAWDGVKTEITLAAFTGSFTSGKYVQGETSGAVGIVKSYGAPTLTVETLYGEYKPSETIRQFDTEDCSGTAEESAAGALGRQSLAETYPDITGACEILVRYLWKHKHDFEVSSTGVDGTNTRRDAGWTTQLTPEARALVDKYRLAIL